MKISNFESEYDRGNYTEPIDQLVSLALSYLVGSCLNGDKETREEALKLHSWAVELRDTELYKRRAKILREF